MSPQFEAAFVRHAALSFEKQLALQEWIGGRSWAFDMNAGVLSFAKKGLFGKALNFDAQILGSASQSDGTWLWAWANRSVDERLARASLFLREKGGLSDFQTPDFALDLSEADDHRVAMTSAGVLAELFGCDAFYRGPHPGGAVFFLLRDPRLHLAPPDLLHLSSVFSQLIAALPVRNHRTALEDYLRARGVESTAENEIIRARIGAFALEARFDELNRLADLQAKNFSSM